MTISQENVSPSASRVTWGKSATLVSWLKTQFLLSLLKLFLAFLSYYFSLSSGPLSSSLHPALVDKAVDSVSLCLVAGS